MSGHYHFLYVAGLLLTSFTVRFCCLISFSFNFFHTSTSCFNIKIIFSYAIWLIPPLSIFHTFSLPYHQPLSLYTMLKFPPGGYKITRNGAISFLQTHIYVVVRCEFQILEVSFALFLY